jgi:uncharacterized protein with von Willebrand factor type A (vWA) domain
MDWLCAFLGHGSDLDVPLRELPGYYQQLDAPRGKTDLIVITDALCHVPRDVGERFLAWKQEVKARLISLVIDQEPGDLARLSDEAHTVQSLAVSEEAVERVLSL